MTLQAKATLGSVLLATIMVTLVSGVDLGSFMDLGLQATLERADVIKDVAKDAVIDALNRRRDVELREALGDAELKGKLLSLLRSPNGVLSIDRYSSSVRSASVIVSPTFFAFRMRKHRRTRAPFGVSIASSSRFLGQPGPRLTSMAFQSDRKST